MIVRSGMHELPSLDGVMFKVGGDYFVVTDKGLVSIRQLLAAAGHVLGPLPSARQERRHEVLTTGFTPSHHHPCGDSMSANEGHIEEARNLVDEWLSEQEGYAIRAERMPEGSRDWLIAACSIGLAAGERRGMERENERVRGILTNLLERIRPIIPRELHGQLDAILAEARKD